LATTFVTLSAIVSAIATIVIAIFAIMSFRLSNSNYELTKSINEANAKVQKEYKLLVKAIAISSVLGSVAQSAGSFSQAWSTFNKYFKDEEDLFES